MHVTMRELLQATAGVGEIADEDRVFVRVQTDSRLVEQGDLFFCIAGERMDGHNFASEAAARGAGGIVAHCPLDLDGDVPVVLVRDTLIALGRLARFWREKCSATVIGVTGSAGKTTVKEMLAAVLGTAGPTGKNFRNWNNQLGLPLSMLAMSGQERFWVLELGISVPGDMDELGMILAPDLAVILNVGPCHLQGLGSEEGVAREKGAILGHLASGGSGVVSQDYPELTSAIRSVNVPVRLFSRLDAEAPVFTSYIGREGGIGLFQVRCREQEMVMRLPVYGEHMAENVAAVVAVADELGLDPANVQSGFSEFHAAPQRFVVHEKGAWTVIDDTYNANPLSMRHSVQQAADMAGAGELVLVLGDMLELGDRAEAEHERLGEFVGATPFLRTYYFGTHESAFLTGLGPAADRCFSLSSPEAFARDLDTLSAGGGVILFKGSRGCAMERFLKVFSEHIK